MADQVKKAGFSFIQDCVVSQFQNVQTVISNSTWARERNRKINNESFKMNDVYFSAFPYFSPLTDAFLILNGIETGVCLPKTISTHVSDFNQVAESGEAN